MTSTAQRSDGSPSFVLEQTQGDEKLFIAKVSSIEYLNKVLSIVEDQKLKELQEIIQGKIFLPLRNRD